MSPLKSLNKNNFRMEMCMETDIVRRHEKNQSRHR